MTVPNLKSYLIANDDFNQRVVAMVVGPSNPDIRELKSKFMQDNFPGYKHRFTAPVTITEMQEQRRNNDIKYQAEKKLKEKYRGETIPELFIEWLVQEYGYKVIDMDTILIPT